MPGSKAQKVYLGAGFCQELISNRACLLKKVNLVVSIIKGGEQSERTPAKSAIKSSPMAGVTCNFACKVVLGGTFD